MLAKKICWINKLIQTRYNSNQPRYTGHIQNFIFGAHATIKLTNSKQSNFLYTDDLQELNKLFKLLERDSQVKALFINSDSNQMFCKGLNHQGTIINSITQKWI